MAGNPVAMLFAETKLMLMDLDGHRPPWGYRSKPAGQPGEGEGTTRIGEELLARSHEAVGEAERLTQSGDPAAARSLLQRTAEELREGAPGSGRPEEVMKVVHSLRELAETLSGGGP